MNAHLRKLLATIQLFDRIEELFLSKGLRVIKSEIFSSEHEDNAHYWLARYEKDEQEEAVDLGHDFTDPSTHYAHLFCKTDDVVIECDLSYAERGGNTLFRPQIAFILTFLMPKHAGKGVIDGDRFDLTIFPNGDASYHLRPYVAETGITNPKALAFFDEISQDWSHCERDNVFRNFSGSRVWQIVERIAVYGARQMTTTKASC